MNKLINVNIGGIVFQIDESAYTKLDAYLDSLKNKYAFTAGGDEILHDIESRLVELFKERITPNGAVMMQHVDEVIAIMGRPEDYDDQATPEATSTTLHARRARRFYRDGDSRLLGGVCSGFAAYFNIDPLFIRIAFLIAFFGFGAGLLLYIILWIIIPVAKTTAEKLEMHGERVNISNIEKKIKDEAAEMKARMNEFGDEIKQTVSKENILRTRASAGEFLEQTAQNLKPFFRTLGKIIAAIVLILCLIIIACIGIELISDTGEINGQIKFLGNYIVGNVPLSWMLISSALALVIIPIIAIVYACSKYLLGIRKKYKGIGWTLFLLWLLCLSSVIFIGIKTGRQFRYEARVSDNINIDQPASGILYVQMNSLDEEDIIWHRDYRENWDGIVLHDDSVILKDIEITFERSPDTSYSIIVEKLAKGSTRDEAKTKATLLRFNIEQQDSLLLIPSGIIFKNGELWRNDEIDITIRVPQDKHVLLDSKLDDMLNNNEYISGLNDNEIYGLKLKMTPAGLKPVY
jgi:phage shock protein C